MGRSTQDANYVFSSFFLEKKPKIRPKTVQKPEGCQLFVKLLSTNFRDQKFFSRLYITGQNFFFPPNSVPNHIFLSVFQLNFPKTENRRISVDIKFQAWVRKISLGRFRQRIRPQGQNRHKRRFFRLLFLFFYFLLNQSLQTYGVQARQ